MKINFINVLPSDATYQSVMQLRTTAPYYFNNTRVDFTEEQPLYCSSNELLEYIKDKCHVFLDWKKNYSNTTGLFLTQEGRPISKGLPVNKNTLNYFLGVTVVLSVDNQINTIGIDELSEEQIQIARMFDLLINWPVEEDYISYKQNFYTTASMQMWPRVQYKQGVSDLDLAIYTLYTYMPKCNIVVDITDNLAYSNQLLSKFVEQIRKRLGVSEE